MHKEIICENEHRERAFVELEVKRERKIKGSDQYR